MDLVESYMVLMAVSDKTVLYMANSSMDPLNDGSAG
uniref:Uncharacterized protein n=1 Tax=viral metagenome TaxID=1070528 RepID=A0A6C0DPI6_9ZZZZ